MPLLLDLLPLGHTLEEEDYVTAVCFAGDAAGSAVATGIAIGTVLLAGLASDPPAHAGDVYMHPRTLDGATYEHAAVRGYAYPSALLTGTLGELPQLRGRPFAVLLTGELLGQVIVGGLIVGPLLAGDVHDSPLLTGEVVAVSCDGPTITGSVVRRCS